MDAQLENVLVKKYPEIFQDMNKTPAESPMAFGIECGYGWFEFNR